MLDSGVAGNILVGNILAGNILVGKETFHQNSQRQSWGWVVKLIVWLNLFMGWWGGSCERQMQDSIVVWMTIRGWVFLWPIWGNLIISLLDFSRALFYFLQPFWQLYHFFGLPLSFLSSLETNWHLLYFSIWQWRHHGQRSLQVASPMYKPNSFILSTVSMLYMFLFRNIVLGILN